MNNQKQKQETKQIEQANQMEKIDIEKYDELNQENLSHGQNHQVEHQKNIQQVQEQHQDHQEHHQNHQEDHQEQKNTHQIQHIKDHQNTVNLDKSAVSLSQNHLPKAEYEKQFLIQKIDNSIKFLQQIINNQKHNNNINKEDSAKNKTDQEYIETLKLRKKLISAQRQYSNQRIDHLQLIFKHYCTHIFKTGKHMTFQRLQYEKIHLTLDRLFIFLKDFGLTVMKVNNSMKDVVQKNQIIKTFKKVSSNCRDLNFQQFIICLQKIAVLYYDCKTTYFKRKQQERAYRDKVKAIILKKQKIKQEMLRRFHQKQDELQIGSKQNKKTEHHQQQQQEQHENANKNESNENDDMMQNLMKVKSSVEDQILNNKNRKKNYDQNQIYHQNQNQRNDEINEDDQIQKNKKNIKIIKNRNQDDLLKENQFAFDPTLLNLTMEEKVQYYYQLIDVDNVQSFRNKLRQLNLPLFQTHHQNQSNQNLKNKKGDNHTKRQAEKKMNQSQASKISQSLNQQNQRLKQLRERLNQRNDKLKQSVPLVSPDQYDKMKRKRSDYHQRMKESIGSRVKKMSVRKIDLTQNQINLSSLSKLAYDNINLLKFNPNNLYSEEADDEIFLRQYQSSPIKKQKKTSSSMSKVTFIESNLKNKNNDKSNVMQKLQQKQKSSHDILQKTKKRLTQIQSSQKKNQLDQLYRLNDRTNRQKRLIQKFMQHQKSKK